MKIYTTRDEVRKEVTQLKSAGKSIGFVPTMGALHEGHLSLIRAAKSACDIVVSSIFVNPTQFTDKKDLENYPRPLEKDLALLEEAGCNITFAPAVDEMYNKAEFWHIDLAGLDTVLEGAIRPGHYQGVTQIVSKLFDTVSPHRAFFGQKDYQQVMVIKHMIRVLKLGLEIIVCPIIREPDGLAMSSRNIHLNKEDRVHALALFRTLSWVREQGRQGDIAALQQKGFGKLSESPGIHAEYLVLFDADTFEPADSDSQSIIALAAAQVGSIRIIDNMYID